MTEVPCLRWTRLQVGRGHDAANLLPLPLCARYTSTSWNENTTYIISTQFCSGSIISTILRLNVTIKGCFDVVLHDEHFVSFFGMYNTVHGMKKQSFMFCMAVESVFYGAPFWSELNETCKYEHLFYIRLFKLAT